MSDKNAESNVVNFSDLGLIKQVAVNEKALDILIEDFKANKLYMQDKLRHIDKNTADIFALIRTFPKEIEIRKEQLDAEIRNELEKHYATIPRIDALETDMINRFEKSEQRSKWTVGIIVSAAGAIQFLTTMYFMSLQISKLTGGG